MKDYPQRCLLKQSRIQWTTGHHDGHCFFLTVPLQRSAGLYRTCQGEMLSLRNVCHQDVEMSPKVRPLLYFDDGGKKGMAAFLNLLGLTALLDVAKPADWEHTQVATLVESIMCIPTIFKHAASESEVDATISRIVKQDLNSKVLPVSSWQWANLLSSLSSAHGTSFKDAIDLYKDHPAVVGTRDSADSAGTGSLEIDTKKQRAIKHWMDKTSEGAFHEVDMHCHDIPFALGAFGEQFAQEAAYFLNSVVELAADPACTLTPMEGESSITVNWKLPMPDDVDINCPQKWFFRRIKFQFHRETSIVPVQQKKKYRISKESGSNFETSCVW